MQEGQKRNITPHAQTVLWNIGFRRIDKNCFRFFAPIGKNSKIVIATERNLCYNYYIIKQRSMA